jgi:arylsulfatase A-like enzyme
MDRIVERGVSFSHCHIMGSTVPAVCICSRASLITGRHLYSVPHEPKAADGLALWPEVFRDHGYETFITGKWHNGPWTLAQSFTCGENIFFGGMWDHLNTPVHGFDPSGVYAWEDRRVATTFSSELFSDSAVRFLREYEGDRPWFMFVAYTAPHDPRMAPREFADLYPPDGIAPPPNFMPEHPFDNGEMRVRDELLAPFPRTLDVIREHIAAYYAMITHLDHHLGRVLDALEARGELGNTIIVLAGDNGLAVGQHGLMGKQNLYEHSVRVPLVVAGPDVPQGRRTDALVYLHDVMPTTLELAGLPIPGTVESASRVPLVRGESTEGLDTVFAAYMGVQRMVRDRRWKLIRYPQVGETQLFDLANDPWEVQNLAGEEAHAGTVERLSEHLRGE